MYHSLLAVISSLALAQESEPITSEGDLQVFSSPNADEPVQSSSANQNQTAIERKKWLRYVAWDERGNDSKTNKNKNDPDFVIRPTEKNPCEGQILNVPLLLNIPAELRFNYQYKYYYRVKDKSDKDDAVLGLRKASKREDREESKRDNRKNKKNKKDKRKNKKNKDGGDVDGTQTTDEFIEDNVVPYEPDAGKTYFYILVQPNTCLEEVKQVFIDAMIEKQNKKKRNGQRANWKVKEFEPKRKHNGILWCNPETERYEVKNEIKKFCSYTERHDGNDHEKNSFAW